MRKQTYLLVIAVLSISILTGAKQRSSEDNSCVNLLKRYVNQMKRFNIPTGKNVYYMNMQIKTVMKDKSKSSNVELKILISDDQLHYISNYISIYQDKQNTFTIVHPQRLVAWSGGAQIADKKNSVDQAGMLQDSLLATGTVVRCEDFVDENDLKFRQITMKPHPNITKRHMIKKMDYFYDLSAETLQKVVLYYGAKSPIDRKITIYKDLNFDYKAKMNSPVSAKVFDNQGKLLAKYRGYELLDNR